MFDTVKMLIESSALPEVDFITENTNNFNMIREATENEILCTKFNPKKIPVIQYDGKYVIEFTDGADKSIVLIADSSTMRTHSVT